jgi:endonuclease YncB( thermonuclease family)
MQLPADRFACRGRAAWLAACFAFAGLAIYGSAPAAADEVRGEVVGIADGDTLTLLAAHRRLRVRLAQIDAPEKGQPYARRSRQSLAQLCFEKAATLSPTGTDRYGRMLATVSCGGINANREQVRRGLAWVYARYARPDSPLYAEERDARAHHRGLWQQKVGQVPPWTWRREHGRRHNAGPSRRR